MPLTSETQISGQSISLTLASSRTAVQWLLAYLLRRAALRKQDNQGELNINGGKDFQSRWGFIFYWVSLCYLTKALLPSLSWNLDAVETNNIPPLFSHALCPSWHIFSLCFPQELHFIAVAERAFTLGSWAG